MTIKKNYSCGICNTKPDQLSHHKLHLKTEKHRVKCELFQLRLLKQTKEELENNYKTSCIDDIVKETETVIYTPINKKLNNKIKQDKIHKQEQNTLSNSKLEDKKQNKKQKYQEQQDNTMSTLKNTTIEYNNSVSNKEALREKIHEIHNYIRNNGAGYGMNALKVFNIIYGLKKIEENGLIDKVGLKRPECEFSYLLNLANNNEHEMMAHLILIDVLDSIAESKIRELLFYEIPKKIRGSVLTYLVKEINTITMIEQSCNVLLSGKIYEYFIGRDETAISELGAYFTDRHIVEYILEKLNPSMNEDGTIPTMIDMFGGSGGFTTGYINYLNDKYNGSINWESEINKISHFDMNEDVIKSAGLEFFCLTGVLPNTDNLTYKNSFTDEFCDRKYMYPLTNPPYGGDKNKSTEAQVKRSKIKNLIKEEMKTDLEKGTRIRRQKQLKKIEAEEKQEKKELNSRKVCLSSCSARIQKFAKNNKLKGNDKEACSLMLLMDIVEKGGTAIGVLKEGVFFNKAYRDLRKCLVENYNVREVISVPSDQFENTSTKTSILIFDNTEEKTSKVKFRELVVDRYKEDKFAEVFGDILLVENKGDIKGVSDKVVSTATREDILNNSICSLNGKDYNKIEIIVGDGYELVKLGDICEIICGKNLPKDKAINGIYNVYGGGNSSYTHNEYNIEGFNIILSRVGNNNISLINEKIYLTDNGFSLNIKDEFTKKFIGYYLSGKKEQIFNLGNGSAQKVITKTQLKQLEIPIPKSESKIQEWVDKISTPYNEKNTKQNKIKELETFVQNRIKEIEENEDCDEVELGSVCEIWCGKNLPKEKSINGIYNVYGGGKSSYTHNEYNLEGFNIIISRVGSNSVTLVNERFYLTDNGFSLIVNDDIKKYLGYYILNNKEQIFNVGNGSAQKVISKSKLSQVKIRIPKNKQLIQDLEPTFQQIEILQQEVKEAETLYKQYIQELSEEAIPKHKNSNEIQ